MYREVNSEMRASEGVRKQETNEKLKQRYKKHVQIKKETVSNRKDRTIQMGKNKCQGNGKELKKRVEEFGKKWKVRDEETKSCFIT